MKRRKEKGEKLFFLIFLIVGIFIFSSVPLLQPSEFVTNKTFERKQSLFFNVEINRYPTKVQVMNYTKEKITVGVNIDPWNLNFGIVPIGKNYASRFVNLYNNNNKTVKVIFKVYGNISNFVTFSKNYFYLKPNESETVQINFNAENATIGIYDGEIDVIVMKPRFNFVYWWGQ